MKKIYITSLRLFMAIICVSLSERVHADNPIVIQQPQIVPVSPEAEAVRKYVSYPVDYSTGLVDITIPLYTIKVGDIELPITLSYHSSGLKVRELSGWVGSGWTLNAEPSIMREINGIPDDAPNGGFRTGEYLTEKNSWDNMTENEKVRFFKRIENKEIDSEPDRFFFKLAKQRGSFYIPVTYDNRDYDLSIYPKFLICPYEPVKINSGIFDFEENGFLMSDRDGISYAFGGEYDNLTEKTGNYSTRWLCKKMSSGSTNAAITFSYSNFIAKPIPMNEYPSNYVAMEDDKYGYRLIIKQGIRTSYGTINSDSTVSIGSSYVENQPYTVQKPYYYADHVKERKIQTINFDHGSVTFNMDSHENLGEMIVKSKTGQVLKRIKFYVSPYNSSQYKTKLDSIVITDADGTQKKNYLFTYFHPLEVPSESSYAMDHWGYYNGRQEMQGYDNAIYAPYGIYKYKDRSGEHVFKFGSNARECRENAMKAGILTKMRSPEGVLTAFTYEINRHGKSIERFMDGRKSDTIFYTGGLRIQKITESDINNSGSSKTRFFTYRSYPPISGSRSTRSIEHSGDGWGIPKIGLSERDYCVEQRMLKINPTTGTQEECRLRTWAFSPVSNITFGNGSSVLYPYVTERIVSSSTEIRNEYTFDTPSWNIFGGGRYDPFDPRSQVRQDISRPFDPDDGSDMYAYGGRLIKKDIFENDKIAERHEYEYSGYQGPTEKDSYFVTTRRPYKTRVCNLEQYQSKYQEKYEEYGWGKTVATTRLKREKITRYPDTGEAANTITQEYIYRPDEEYLEEYFDDRADLGSQFHATAHLNPLAMKTTTGDGKEVIERFNYANNVISSPLYGYKRIYNNDSTKTACSYSGQKPLKARTWNNELQAYEDRLCYTYDTYGNVSSVTTDGRTYTCYLWSYCNQYPIAKIVNVTYDALLSALGKNKAWVEQLGNMTTPDTEMETINALRQKLPEAHVYTYTHRILVGVTSITEPDGSTTYFEYDTFGRFTRSYILENGVQKTISTNEYNLPKFGRIDIINAD
ncbi:sugar-binding protein [Coprobacter sp.]